MGSGASKYEKLMSYFATAKSLILVLYFTWVYASFHPSQSDNAANVILLRRPLDALHLKSVIY